MPGSNLTRIEAEERKAVIEAPIHYHVDLDLTVGAKNFGSKSLICFNAKPGSSTFLDLIADEVTSIDLNGKSLDPAVAFQDNRIELTDLKEKNEVTVEAKCRYSNTGEGLHRSVDPSDGNIYLYSQFEVPDARRVYAVFDQPDLKATFDFKVLAPASWIVTSNMPVAAREASIYTGVTLAEYYRDMGYDVAIMADSTSRWAEALRELSGRLEEMPAEEGFPAYLASKLSAFYERAGMMQNLNGTEGSVSIIGAVSPQGGDFSEPVTQNTKRFVRCFWGLDKALAYARHFPAIQWLTSYSEYLEDLTPWYREHVSPKFVYDRNQIMAILNQESSLMEIVKLIGSDVLPDDQKLTLEIARVIRLGFLQQNAFHQEDTSVPMEKQFLMMETILYLYEKCRALVNRGMPVSVLKEDKIFERIIAIKYEVPNKEPERFDEYHKDIDRFYDNVLERNG